MQMIRAINVITLACLLLLTGCFGLVDDELTTPAEGTGTGVDVVNHAPSITTSETLNSVFAESEQYEPYYNTNDRLEGFTFSLYHAAIDIDGDNLTVGWDTNLDGMIDVNATTNSGVTEFSIPVTEMNELDGFDYEGYYHSIFALIAIDEHGLGNSIFVETYHIDFDAYDDYTDGNLALYQFIAEDARTTAHLSLVTTQAQQAAHAALLSSDPPATKFGPLVTVLPSSNPAKTFALQAKPVKSR